jgi:hypothetical protein
LKKLEMQSAIQRRIGLALLALLLSVAFEPRATFAQSGSTGGSIGNDEKSLSGSRAAPRAVESEKPVRRSKPRAEPEEPRRAARKGGGGGGGNNFDGVWIVTGVGVTCQGSSSNPIVITSGKIIGKTSRGTVSSSGVVNGTAQGNGLTMITTGRLSGRSGGGSWRQSDGCTGTWTALKQ